MRNLSFSILEFDAEGALDLPRLNAQQVARVDSMLAGVLGLPARDTSVIEATSRFIARGGSWSPDARLRRRIEAAAMGTLPCRRVRVVD